MRPGIERGRSLWSEPTLRDPHGQRDKAARVEAMFDAIAPTYERVNAVVSFGRDAAWRRRTVRAADLRNGDVVLDVCCGTGDMLRAFASTTKPSLVIGVDFAAGMLAQFAPAASPPSRSLPGRAASPSFGCAIQLCRADAQRLPLADASVDVVSCAFGVRNFQDLDAGLGEMRRVLRPGGRLVILEFAQPGGVIARWLCGVYCDVVLPRVATWISRDRSGAYRYLPRSIRTFEPPAGMMARLERVGFGPVASESMNLGSVVLYRGVASP